MRLFACECGELTALEKRLLAGEAAEDLGPELVAAARAVVAAAPSWAEACEAMEEAGRPPLPGGPEVYQDFLSAVGRLASLPLEEDPVQRNTCAPPPAPVRRTLRRLRSPGPSRGRKEGLSPEPRKTPKG